MDHKLNMPLTISHMFTELLHIHTIVNVISEFV